MEPFASLSTPANSSASTWSYCQKPVCYVHSKSSWEWPKNPKHLRSLLGSLLREETHRSGRSKALWENTVFRSLLTMVEEHETKQNYTPCYLGEKIQCFWSLLTMVELGVQLVRSQEEKCWDRELKPESSLIGPYLRVKQKYKTQLMLLFAREEVYVLSIQRNTKLPFLPPRCFPSPLHFSLKNLKFSNLPMFRIINIRPYESHEDPLAGVMVQECYRWHQPHGKRFQIKKIYEF